MSRKLLLILLIPAILLTGGYFFLRGSLRAAVAKDDGKSTQTAATDTLGGKKVSAVDLRPLFIQRMQQLLSKSSKGLYTLTVGDMEVDVLASTLVFKNVKMAPDKTILEALTSSGRLPNDVYTVSFDALQIEGINIDDALTSKTMDYKLVKLVKPVIVIHHKKDGPKKAKTGQEDFSESFLKEMEKLSIERLLITEGDVSVVNDAKGAKPNKLKHVSVELNNILVDAATRKDKDRFLFAKSGLLSFKDFEKPTPDGLYYLRVKDVTVTAPQQQVTLTGFSFTSPFSRAEFSKKQKQSKELYNVVLPSITMAGVDWWTMLNEEEITADLVQIPQGKISIYLDRSLPPKNKMGNFPNQMLMKMPLKLNIAKLAISNIDFSYGEFNPLSQQTGTIYLDNIKLNVSNFSNLQTKPMQINGTALFMRRVPMSASFVFDMVNHRAGNFSTQIKIDGFDSSHLNNFLKPMALARVDEGTVQSVTATIKGNQMQASGNVLLLYKDLELSLLEKDKGEKVLDKKGFTTLVANLFVLKKSNPKGGAPARNVSASFTRNPMGGYFTLVWKTLLVGILKTIGAPEKMASKTTSATKQK